jgi:hypothetical protein
MASEVKYESKLKTTDMIMLRWICGVSLRDKVPSTELRARIGVEPIVDVCRRLRLRWFGHVKRKGDVDRMKRGTQMEQMEVDGKHG